MKKSYYLRITCFLLATLFYTQASIATVTSWKGITNAWASSSNWTNGVPTGLLDVNIGDASFTGGIQPIISLAATARSLTIGGTASNLTINAALTVGNIYINSNGTLTHGNATITITGNWENAGTYTANNVNSTVTFKGINQSIGGTALTTFRILNINPTNIVSLTNNIALNGVTSTAGFINVLTGTFDLSTFTANRGMFSGGGGISLAAGAFLKIGGTNGFPSNYAGNGGVINKESTVEYNGDNQLIASRIYGNLVLSSSGGAVVKTAVSNINTKGDINIGASTTFVGGTFSYSIDGNWANNGTFIPGLSTIIFNGESEITGNPVQNFYNVNVVGTLDLMNEDTVKIQNLSIEGVGAGLTLNYSALQIAGTIENSGAFDASHGVIEMNGVTAQTIPENTFQNNTVDNLIISNTSLEGVILDGAVDVYGSLTYSGTGMNLTTNDVLTLKSTEKNTANIGDMTGNTIIGKVTVERYIPVHRAWRLLTSPVNTNNSQTIHDAWQEGVNNTTLDYSANLDPSPGYGTHITSGTASALGFDVGLNSNPSIKGYNTATGAWDGVFSTNIPITDYPAYMLFVRGDRGTDLSAGVSAPATPTTLRSNGELKQDNQTYNVAATGFTVISNPYASLIDLNGIAKLNSSNIQDNFYVWDPEITGTNGVGGFVNISWDSANSIYDITPSDGDGIDQFILSGSAFLAKSADSATDGTLTITESDKSGGGDVSRPLNTGSVGKVITNLYSLNKDGTTSIVDGVLNSYSTAYSNALDNNDAIKLSNLAESLCSWRSGHSLTVERRQPLTTMDTIYYRMAHMKQKEYTLEFKTEGLGSDGLAGFLEDNYLHTTKPVNLNGITNISFTVTGVAESAASDRFSLVFRPAASLPVTLNSIKATKQGEEIQIAWKTENEAGIKEYEVEKSADGLGFASSAMVTANHNSSKGTYSWLDNNVMKGNNYYRIKSIGLNGEKQYSLIVKVYMGKGKEEIVLNTNMIRGGTINFNMNNMPAGKYGIRLINSLGQEIFRKQVVHTGGSSSESIEPKAHLARGIYMLEFTEPGNKRVTRKIEIE